MTGREKIIQRILFQYLSNREDAGIMKNSLQKMFNASFKSNGLLTSAAFIEGKLVKTDEVRNVIRKMAADGLMEQWDNLSDVYFKLTDAGVIELKNQQSDAEEFSLSADEVTKARWSRLKSVNIDRANAETVSTLINRSLDELGRQRLSNEQHSQAAAYMMAAKELVNAPSPPSEIIWDLIYKAAAIAGIVQLILPIFAVLT